MSGLIFFFMLIANIGISEQNLHKNFIKEMSNQGILNDLPVKEYKAYQFYFFISIGIIISLITSLLISENSLHDTIFYDHFFFINMLPMVVILSAISAFDYRLKMIPDRYLLLVFIYSMILFFIYHYCHHNQLDFINFYISIGISIAIGAMSLIKRKNHDLELIGFADAKLLLALSPLSLVFGKDFAIPLILLFAVIISLLYTITQRILFKLKSKNQIIEIDENIFAIPLGLSIYFSFLLIVSYQFIP